MKLEQLFKTTDPIVLIYGVNTPLTLQLVKLLQAQGARIILTDYSNKSVTETLKRIPEYGQNSLYIDFNTLKRRFGDIPRLEFIFDVSYHRIAPTSYLTDAPPKLEISHAEYLKYTEASSLLMQHGVNLTSTYSLILPAFLEQLTEPVGSFNLELFEHLNLMASEFRKKHRLNIRTFKIGEPIGDLMDLSTPTITTYILKRAKNKTITVPGDGLQPLALLPVYDGARLILMGALTKRSAGKRIRLVHPESPSVMSFIHTLSEVLNKDLHVKFNPQDVNYNKVTQFLSRFKELQAGSAPENFNLHFQLSIEQAIEYAAKYITQETAQQRSSLLKRLKPSASATAATMPKRPTANETDYKATTPSRPAPTPYKPLTQRALEILLAPWRALYNFVIAPNINPLLGDDTSLKVFIMFTLKVMLVMVIALLIAPFVQLGIEYYHMRATLNQIQHSPPTTPQDWEWTLQTLKSYQRNLDISIPEQLRALPIIENYTQDMQYINHTVPVLEAWLDITVPIQKYLETADPAYLDPLIERARFSPTYLMQVQLIIEQNKEYLPDLLENTLDTDAIQALNNVFAIMPEVLGFNKPITISLKYTQSKKPQIQDVVTLTLKEGQISATPDPATNTLTIELSSKTYQKLLDIAGVNNLQQLTRVFPQLALQQKNQLMITLLNAVSTKDIKIYTTNAALVQHFGL